MLHSLNNLDNFELFTVDGPMGFCKDFLFNDEQWSLHYLLADTHKWVPGGKKMLIHSNAIEEIDAASKIIRLNVTARQLKDSPSLLSSEPISRAYEKTYMCYFDYATYHVGPIPLDTWFVGVHPERVKLVSAPAEPASEKNHVHSAHFVEDYDLDVDHTKHGKIVDFVFDDKTWNIVFLAIELKAWAGHSQPVLLAPNELEVIDWANQQVHVELPVETLKNSPVFKVSRLPSQDLRLLISSD